MKNRQNKLGRSPSKVHPHKIEANRCIGLRVQFKDVILQNDMYDSQPFSHFHEYIIQHLHTYSPQTNVWRP